MDYKCISAGSELNSTRPSLTVKRLRKIQMDNRLSHHFLGSFSTDSTLSSGLGELI